MLLFKPLKQTQRLIPLHTWLKKDTVISKNHLHLAISPSKNYLRGHYNLKKQKGEKERKINAPLF